MALVRMIGRALLLLLLIAVGPLAVGATVAVDPAFGYRIGDTVLAVADLSVDSGARLDAESVPKVGRVNGWLALLDVRVTPRDNGWRVVRVFQVTASAVAPKMLFLPRADLKFRLGAREFNEPLESVPISVSPMSSTEPILRAGFGALRPDRDVPQPKAGEAMRRAQVAAAVLAGLALLWLAVRSLAMRRRGFAPFGVAAKRLRRLARTRGKDNPDPVVAEAYRIMHEAFNEAAGQAVFSSHKERFLAAHPRLGAEAGAVRAFFDRSEQAFFAVSSAAGPHPEEPAGRPGAKDLDWLADLARRLARLEQPGR